MTRRWCSRASRLLPTWARLPLLNTMRLSAVELSLVSARTNADPLELEGFTTMANPFRLKVTPMLCNVRIVPSLELQLPIRLTVLTVAPPVPTVLSTLTEAFPPAKPSLIHGIPDANGTTCRLETSSNCDLLPSTRLMWE